MLRVIVAILALTLAAWAAGCAENAPPVKEREAARRQTPAAAASSGEEARVAPAVAEKALSIPAGAEWTIYCQTFAGPAHTVQAKQVKEGLVQSSGMRDWYVVTGERESTIYYGFYQSADTSDDDGRRAHGDRAKIDALTDASGDRPFKYSIIVPLSSPDPLASPEWNLENAPPEKYWSLQIAAYKDSPDRKQAAVESVREARAQGIEAYYYHGEQVSHVCIGAWPREALKAQEADADVYDDPSKPLLVLPPGLPEEVAGKIQVSGNQDVTRVMPKVQVVDPSLLAAMEQYPNHAVNWEFQYTKVRNPQTGQVEKVLEPSLIVVIPRRTPSILSGDGTVVTGAPTHLDDSRQTGAPVVQQPKKPSMTQGLKSIGE